MSLQGILYVPNGPMLIDPAVDGRDASRIALRERGKKFSGDLDAVFVVTPHFSTRGGIAVVSTAKMSQIFDFSGFPPEFYEVKYEPPGNPHLARKLVFMGRSRGLPLAETDRWGLDHGAWTSLVHLFPNARVPVVPVSVMAGGDPSIYLDLGKAIAEIALSSNIALISTGSLIHRLDLFQNPGGELPEDAAEYLKMVLKFLGNSDWKAVWDIPEKYYRAAAPEGGLAPMMALAGATGDEFRAEVLSNEIMYNSVSMTTIEFGKK